MSLILRKATQQLSARQQFSFWIHLWPWTCDKSHSYFYVNYTMSESKQNAKIKVINFSLMLCAIRIYPYSVTYTFFKCIVLRVWFDICEIFVRSFLTFYSHHILIIKLTNWITKYHIFFYNSDNIDLSSESVSYNTDK